MKFSIIRIGVWISIFLLFVFNGFSNESVEKNSLKDIRSNKELKIDYLSKIYTLMQQNQDSAFRLLLKFSENINPKEKEIQIRYKTILASYYWKIGNLDTAAFIFRQNIDSADKYELMERKINSFSNLGAILNVMGLNDSAYFYLNASLPLALEMGDSSKVSKIRLDLGSYFKNKGYYHLALDHLLQSKEYYEKNRQTKSLVYVYNTLGVLYTALENCNKAQYYFHLGIKMDSLSNDVFLLHDLFNNLGVCLWKLEHDLDSARFYMNRSLDISLKYNSPNYQLVYLLNLGGLALEEEKYDRAFEYLSKAESLETKVDNAYKLSALYINLGTYNYAQKNYPISRDYYKKGIGLAKTINAFDNLKNGFRSMAKLDSAQGNYLAALGYFRTAQLYQDSLRNIDEISKVAELEIIHQTKQKEQQNTLLIKQNDLQSEFIKTQKLVNYIIGLALLGLFVFSILLLINRKKLKKARQLADSKNDKISKQNRLIENKKLILKQQKNELAELNQTKDKFFAIIAHDLKNPFSSLLGLLDILETDFHELEEDNKLEIIRKLANSGRNTYNMLVNLLDWARAQRGHIDPHIERLNLLKLVEASVLFLSQRISGKDHNVVHHIGNEIFVLSDKNLLMTILINILNNSVKFTKAGGIIEINAEISEEKVLISISDNGIGMNQEKLNDLFKITSKSSSRGTEDEQGTGLGLILCKEFVHLINGAIWVESELGVGSTFYVEIPLATKTSQPILD